MVGGGGILVLFLFNRKTLIYQTINRVEKDSEITRECKEMQERVKAPKEADIAHKNIKKTK